MINIHIDGLELKDFFEIASYISTVLLLIFAFLGLNQITIAKEASALTAKREAYKLAVEQCRYFMEEIFPIHKQLAEKVKMLKLNAFMGAEVYVLANFVNVTYPGLSGNTEDFKSPDLAVLEPQIHAMMNKLDIFSLSFVSGIADEDTAFYSIGEHFLDAAKVYYPYVKLVNGLMYDNVDTLYVHWQEKVKTRRTVGVVWDRKRRKVAGLGYDNLSKVKPPLIQKVFKSNAFSLRDLLPMYLR